MRSARTIFLSFSVLVLAATNFSQGPKDNWAKFGDVNIHYYDIGNSKAKSALVFVHCWTCNVEFWKESYNVFPQYRVIALDLPGHGKSDKPKIDYSMQYFANAVDAVLKKAGVQKSVLVGHSMGTPVVRRYYELHPEKTLGIVVVDGALIPFGQRDQVEKFFEPLYKDYKPAAENMIDGMLQPARAEVRPFIKSNMLATPDYVGASAAKFMLQDAYETHSKFNIPVLAVMAPSPYWPPDLKEKYQAIIPNLDFQMFTGVSHFLMLEKPKEFNEAVANFISKNKLL